MCRSRSLMAILGFVWALSLGRVASAEVWIDSPSDGARVQRTFSLGGWAIDRRAPGGNGVDVIHVYAYPKSGSNTAPIFLGETRTGGSRPDVGRAYGSRFSQSGFGLSTRTSLEPGRYMIVVYGRSLATSTFDQARAVNVDVADGTGTGTRVGNGQALMWVDIPSSGATVSPTFAVGGWGIDSRAASGDGTDAVHVYAYPSAGGNPIFVGATTTGVSRPDVAVAFGSRFGTSGFGMRTSRALGDGRYRLVVYVRSTATGGFDAAKAVDIQVAGGSGGQLKVLHWNTHHGVGMDGQYNIERIATVIAAANPDLVSLNEVEQYTSFGSEHQPERYRQLLERNTGQRWYYVFAQQDGGWSSNGMGNLMLSRFPFTSTTRHALSWGRSLAIGSVVVEGRTVTMMSTHLDADSSSRREQQAREVVNAATGFSESRVIAGDLNASPGQSPVVVMDADYDDAWALAVSQGTAYYYGSYSSGQTRNGRIDYIFHSEGARGLKLVKMRLIDPRDSSGQMPSDHRPILATYDVR